MAFVPMPKKPRHPKGGGARKAPLGADFLTEAEALLAATAAEASEPDVRVLRGRILRLLVDPTAASGPEEAATVRVELLEREARLRREFEGLRGTCEAALGRQRDSGNLASALERAIAEWDAHVLASAVRRLGTLQQTLEANAPRGREGLALREAQIEARVRILPNAGVDPAIEERLRSLPEVLADREAALRDIEEHVDLIETWVAARAMASELRGWAAPAAELEAVLEGPPRWLDSGSVVRQAREALRGRREVVLQEATAEAESLLQEFRNLAVRECDVEGPRRFAFTAVRHILSESPAPGLEALREARDAVAVIRRDLALFDRETARARTLLKEADVAGDEAEGLREALDRALVLPLRDLPGRADLLAAAAAMEEGALDALRATATQRLEEARKARDALAPDAAEATLLEVVRELESLEAAYREGRFKPLIAGTPGFIQRIGVVAQDAERRLAVRATLEEALRQGERRSMDLRSRSVRVTRVQPLLEAVREALGRGDTGSASALLARFESTAREEHELHEKIAAVREGLMAASASLAKAGGEPQFSDLPIEDDNEDFLRRLHETLETVNRKLEELASQAQLSGERLRSLLERLPRDDPDRERLLAGLSAVVSASEQGRYGEAGVRGAALLAATEGKVSLWVRRIQLEEMLRAAVDAAKTADVDDAQEASRAAEELAATPTKEGLNDIAARIERITEGVNQLRAEAATAVSDARRKAETLSGGAPLSAQEALSEAASHLDAGRLRQALGAAHKAGELLAEASDLSMRIRVEIDVTEQRLRKGSHYRVDVKDLLARLEVIRLEEPSLARLQEVGSVLRAFEERAAAAKKGVQERVALAQSVLDELGERGIRTDVFRARLEEAQRLTAHGAYGDAGDSAEAVISAARRVEDLHGAFTGALERLRTLLGTARAEGLDIAPFAGRVAQARMLDDFEAGVREIQDIEEALRRGVEEHRAPPATPPVPVVPPQTAGPRVLAPLLSAEEAARRLPPARHQVSSILAGLPREAEELRQQVREELADAESFPDARQALQAVEALKGSTLRRLAEFNRQRRARIEGLRNQARALREIESTFPVEIEEELDRAALALQQGMYVEADEAVRRVERLLRESAKR